LPGRKKISARGVSHAQSFTLLLFCFILFYFDRGNRKGDLHPHFTCIFYFIFACIILSKIQKIASFIVAFICLLLVLLEWVLLRTPSCVTLLAPKNNDFICTPIAPPAPEAKKL
jgi:hypothetical protein